MISTKKESRSKTFSKKVEEYNQQITSGAEGRNVIGHAKALMGIIVVKSTGNDSGESNSSIDYAALTIVIIIFTLLLIIDLVPPLLIPTYANKSNYPYLLEDQAPSISQEEWHFLISERDKAQQEKVDLEKMISKKDEELASLKTNNDELQTAIESLKSKIAALEKELEDSKTTNTSDKDEMKGGLNDRDETIKTLESQLETEKNRCKELEEKLLNINSAHERLKRQIRKTSNSTH